MALILAVEPDRKQAALVRALASDRLAAELVIDESAERALRALGTRVPDVVLTSPLLSWHDDMVLGDRLRELGDAAAHVQTLTIPILAATARPASRKRGVLSALRTKRGGKATTDGCDPEVFAQQIAEYLARVDVQRSEPEVQSTEPEIQWTEPEVAAPVVIELVVSGMVEPIDDGFALTAPGDTLEAVPEEAVEAERLAPLGEALEAHPLLDFNALPDAVIAALPVVEVLPVFEPEPPVALGPAPAPWVDLSLEEIAAHAAPVAAAPEPAEPDVWILEPVADVAEILQHPGPTGIDPGPTGADPGPTSADSGPTSVDSGPTSVDVRPIPFRKKKKKSKPAQDEWGLFDPEQCGFAALIAKLEAVTDDEQEADARRVRVIGH